MSTIKLIDSNNNILGEISIFKDSVKDDGLVNKAENRWPSKDVLRILEGFSVTETDSRHNQVRNDVEKSIR